jgi:hypothetical protein
MRNPSNQSQNAEPSRRRFLASAAATVAGCSVEDSSGRNDAVLAPEIITVGPPVRTASDIEGWNIGLISASRPYLTADENQARSLALLHELTHFARYRVRGCYTEFHGSAEARVVEAHAYLVIGPPDDSGNLKGFLRKIGRKYEQDAVIHKGYYRDAELHALRDLPDQGLREMDRKKPWSVRPGSPRFLLHHDDVPASSHPIDSIWGS